MRGKFFIIDGHALIYRSYFAFSNNHMVTKEGFVTSAIFGFTNVLLDLIKKQDPNYLCVVFDTKAKTWRHCRLGTYKSNRPKQPEDITKSFKFIFDILDAFSIKFYFKDGFEADDVIGTISRKIPDNIDVFIMTPDKDYDQLVNEHVFLYKPKARKYLIIKKEDVLSKWGIEKVSQVVDVLAIIGDKCDNIEGISGIGIKTASKIVSRYGSLENIISNIDNLSQQLKTKFYNNQQKVMFYKELVTIKTDCDIKFDISDCKITVLNNEKIESIFNSLEFNSLLNKTKKIFNNIQNLF